MDLTLRIADTDDIPAMIAIHEACCVEITGRLGPGHWSYAPTYGGLLASMEHRSVYVAFSDNCPVATVTTGTEPASFWPTGIWAQPAATAQCVFGLAVLPTLQRNGIGTWLMRRLEDMACQCGHRWVRLDAYAANPRSQAFYRKLGYEPRGEITVNGTRLVCFEKELDFGG